VANAAILDADVDLFGAKVGEGELEGLERGIRGFRGVGVDFVHRGLGFS
jgi:hypothetical protein